MASWIEGDKDLLNLLMRCEEFFYKVIGWSYVPGPGFSVMVHTKNNDVYVRESSPYLICNFVGSIN
jgi:hypothetical protein